MDVREIDSRDEAAVRRHWEIGEAAVADRRYAFHPTWEQAWLSLRQGRDDLDVRLFGAYADETMWGAGRLDVNRYDNQELGTVEYAVHPDAQRRGTGRALAEASYDLAARHGCTRLMGEAYAPVEGTSAAVEFGRALGFATVIVDEVKVVDLVQTEPGWAALEERAAARRGAYRIVAWHDRVPDDLLEGFCRLNSIFFDQAPMGTLEMAPEVWDEKRVREREDRNARTGKHLFGAGAVAPDGALVGFTEVCTTDLSPERAVQSGTIVDPDHRGHALGLASKLANHRQLREHAPQCRLLITENADVNVSMNAVNDALGYREVERCEEMEREVPRQVG